MGGDAEAFLKTGFECPSRELQALSNAHDGKGLLDMLLDVVNDLSDKRIGVVETARGLPLDGDKMASYTSLRGFAFYWDNAKFDKVPDSKPGKIGARASKLYQILIKGHHDLKLNKGDLHRLTLWMDCNSDFYGSYENLTEQKEGKVVWPMLE